MDCCFPYRYNYCSFCNKILGRDIYFYNIIGYGKHNGKNICQDCLTYKILDGINKNNIKKK